MVSIVTILLQVQLIVRKGQACETGQSEYLASQMRELHAADRTRLDDLHRYVHGWELNMRNGREAEVLWYAV